MIETMRVSKGVGLAAPQVAVSKRIIVVDDQVGSGLIALINPEITKFEGKTVEDFEGCLSIKGIYGKVPRASKIRVKALDIHGNEVRIKAEGFLARVLQHEIDHTNGVLFIDHIRDKKDAFYQLDEDGELQPLNYEKDIRNNTDLWDDLNEE